MSFRFHIAAMLSRVMDSMRCGYAPLSVDLWVGPLAEALAAMFPCQAIAPALVKAPIAGRCQHSGKMDYG